jgi:hypothetical protein
LGAGDVDMPDATEQRTCTLDEEDEEDKGDMDAIVDVFKNIVYIAHDVETAE